MRAVGGRGGGQGGVCVCDGGCVCDNDGSWDAVVDFNDQSSFKVRSSSSCDVCYYV